MIDAHLVRPPLSAVIIGDRATPLALAGAATARAWKGMKAPPRLAFSMPARVLLFSWSGPPFCRWSGFLYKWQPLYVCPGFGDISFTAGAVVFCYAGRALLLYGGREAQSRRPGSIQEHEKLRAGGDPGIPAPTSHGPRWGPTGESRSVRSPALVLGHEKPEFFY